MIDLDFALMTTASKSLILQGAKKITWVDSLDTTIGV